MIHTLQPENAVVDSICKSRKRTQYHLKLVKSVLGRLLDDPQGSAHQEQYERQNVLPKREVNSSQTRTRNARRSHLLEPALPGDNGQRTGHVEAVMNCAQSALHPTLVLHHVVLELREQVVGLPVELVPFLGVTEPGEDVLRPLLEVRGECGISRAAYVFNDLVNTVEVPLHGPLEAMRPV